MTNEPAKKEKGVELDFVELLRSKTEENDMKHFLKSTMGGYSKQSVLDYLAILRKNQQSMAETFYENQQLLYVEKEKLRKDNEKLQTKLSELDTKYLDLTTQVNQPLDNSQDKAMNKALTEEMDNAKGTIAALQEKIDGLTLQNIGLTDEIATLKEALTQPAGTSEATPDELLQLKQQVVSLELELQEGVALLEKLTNENEDLKSKLELSLQEAETRKSLLLSNDTESLAQRARAEELAGELEAASQTLQEERVKWQTEKAAMENEKLKLEEEVVLAKQTNANASMKQRASQDIDLLMRVNELTEQLALQTDLVASENTERTIREETIRSLTAQIEALKVDSATFKTTIENLTLQNEKLLLANSTMCTRMEEECRRTTTLINEKSDVFIEKLTAMKKLSEAETKISMLEMELSKYR